MRKKLLRIAAIILIIAIAICLFPWPCPIIRTLTTTKIDSFGNNMGTVDISMRGFKTHSLIFGEKWYKLKISAFDNFLAANHNMSSFKKDPIEPYKKITVVVNNVTYDGDIGQAIKDDALITTSYSYTIYHSLDYDMWLFKVGGTYYIGSLSGDYTAQEIIEHFNILIPGL